jgi:hypothetical protein
VVEAKKALQDLPNVKLMFLTDRRKTMNKYLVVLLLCLLPFSGAWFWSDGYKKPPRKEICVALIPFIQDCERACKAPYSTNIKDNYDSLQARLPKSADEYLQKSGDKEFAEIIRGMVWHASASGLLAGWSPSQTQSFLYFRARLKDLEQWCSK